MRIMPRPKKANEVTDCPQEEGLDDLDLQGAVGGQPQVPSPSMAELSSLLRCLMEQQSDREVKWEQDRKRQEERWWRVQHQFSQLQSEVRQERQDHQLDVASPADSVPPSISSSVQHEAQQVLMGPASDTDAAEASRGQLSNPGPRFTGWKGPKMQPYHEDEDIEHYLTTFERIAHACQWPREDWALHLAPLLTGRARAAYVALDIEETMDYVKVKNAVLHKYEINAESYRVRFRTSEVEDDETPKELQARLKDLYDKWMNPKDKTKEQIGDAIIMEQFLRILNPELRTWVKERNPASSKDAAEMAETFLAARRTSRPFTSPRPHRAPLSSGKPAGGNGWRDRHIKQGPSSINTSIGKEFRNRGPLACHLCGQVGHFKADCPGQHVSKTCMCFAPTSSGRDLEGGQHQEFFSEERTVCVSIEDKTYIALLDSGSNRTLVRPDCLPRDVIFIEGKVSIWCVHGDNVDYPIAEVPIQVEGQQYLLTVGVMEKLPYQVVLGRDLPVLYDLIAKYGVEQSQNRASEAMVAVTRSRGRQEQSESAWGWEELPFADVVPVVEEARQPRVKKSRSQRRQDRVRGTEVEELLPQPDCSELQLIPGNVTQLQKQDPSLQPLFNKCVPETTQVTEKGSEVFILRGGQLFRRSKLSDQLVVPQSLRPTVLQLSHSVPWAGHLGQQKTFARMVPRFYWPQQFADTVQYCKACPQCQLTAPSRKGERAPLITMPVIDTPFSRIAMDIVGPLERSSGGHKYILVVCDYATRYPEAFPLKKIKARQVVNCLIQLFSRVGIPTEIITDQGTNFTSKLLKEVYSLLGIRGVKTSPYHPQTDGLVERFNKTLKSMLRKFVADTGSDWDQWLPFLLFAYREVPQASTGFSPFQLLYGHPVRGPLDVLKEAWEESQLQQQQHCSSLAYVLKMRDKLDEYQELANSHLVSAQQRQKVGYDKTSRRRSFQEGQKVLLLLPTSDSSLLAKWQGPYEVIKKVGPVTYELYLPDRRRKHQVFHMNLLREWVDRPGASAQLWARAVVDEEELQEQYFPSSAGAQAFPDLSHLTRDQREELEEGMPRELFSLQPGCTDLIKHEIRLLSSTQQPIRETSCRVPAKLIPALKHEVEDMLAMGIIEPSHSEWCSSVVLVPKKDDPKLRFCVNFSRLNAVSAFDPYPMPRVDELIDRLGKATHLTTLDLCKGYWQIPLTEASKDLTTFRVPSGLYRFRTMPFGLHGAPATFQRLVDEVLRGADDYAAAYIDDIVVFSQTWEEHVEHLADVFRRIQSAGLVINARKCHIAKPEVQYLGYVIGGGAIRPQVGKVEAIEAWPLPSTKRQVRSFLGLMGWYRRFIPNFSSRSAVLSDLTRKSSPVKVKMTPECVAAFDDLKKSLCIEPLLQCPNFELPFTVQTDASGRGLGAVLLQGEGDVQRPVQFISRKLFPREVRYSTVEKEALAVKWALDSLKYYLIGKEFLLETDHRALQWIHRMKDTNARITRWYLSLQPFRFQIKYKPGHQNVIADFLSRSSDE